MAGHHGKGSMELVLHLTTISLKGHLNQSHAFPWMTDLVLSGCHSKPAVHVTVSCLHGMVPVSKLL